MSGPTDLSGSERGAVPRKLRLAVFGPADANAGSVASGNAMVLNEMVRQGHHIDYLGLPPWLAAGGVGGETFRFLDGSIADQPSHLERLSSRLGRVGHIVHPAFVEGRIRRAAELFRQQNGRRPYDALLFLGWFPSFRLQGVPTIAWPQGPPFGESSVLRTLRSPLVLAGHRRDYWAARARYFAGDRVRRRALTKCDLVVVGSSWSVDMLRVHGVRSTVVAALPYPLDLDAFAPAEASPQVTGRFIWIGRADPRKRLDLAIDAFRLVRAERPDARFTIVGGLGSYPGIHDSLTNGSAPDVEYVPSVPRSAVPGLLSNSDVFVQTSEHENFGSGPAEAAACGRLSVIGPTNGTADHLGPGVVRFSAYEVESVARAMTQALDTWASDPSSTQRLIREHAELVFRADSVANSMVQLVRRVQSESGSIGSER